MTVTLRCLPEPAPIELVHKFIGDQTACGLPKTAVDGTYLDGVTCPECGAFVEKIVPLFVSL